MSRAAGEFRAFLDTVGEWAATNADRIGKVYLVVGREMLNLYAVPRRPDYDFELRQSLSDLIVSLRDAGTPVRGMLIPDGTPEELQAFFEPRGSFFLSIQ